MKVMAVNRGIVKILGWMSRIKVGLLVQIKPWMRGKAHKGSDLILGIAATKRAHRLPFRFEWSPCSKCLVQIRVNTRVQWPEN